MTFDSLKNLVVSGTGPNAVIAELVKRIDFYEQQLVVRIYIDMLTAHIYIVTLV